MGVKNLDWFQDSAGFGLRVSVDCPNYAKELVDAFKSDNRPYEIDIRPAGTKRSLDANGYFWALCGKLAAKTRVPKADIYRNYIKNIGGNYDTVCVQDKAVLRLVTRWSKNGLGWIAEPFESKIPGCTNVNLYYGSATYDTAQMSRLIDLVVFDCKENGIETMTPEELARLKGAWTSE